MKQIPFHSITLIAMMAILTSCGITHYNQDNAVHTLELQLTEPGWDGATIPQGQQCRKYGGNGHSPQITVSNIPSGTEAIIVEFSDYSWFPMNHGGHGKLGITLTDNQSSIVIPSISGESFELPQTNIFIFHPHRGGRGKPGAYLPPCSGGRGNRYFADVKAVRQIDIKHQTAELLSESSLFLGQY